MAVGIAGNSDRFRAALATLQGMSDDLTSTVEHTRRDLE
jgi:hypothetical protein